MRTQDGSYSESSDTPTVNGSHHRIGEIVSRTAGLRVREEERALIPPGEFLPVFKHYLSKANA